MRMKIKKVTVLLCTSMFLFTSVCPVFGDNIDPPYEEDSYTKEKKTEEVMNLTAVKAVEYALENNQTIKMLDNKIELAIVASNNAEKNAEDFEDAEDKLNDASRLLSANKTELMAVQTDIAAAQNSWAKGELSKDTSIPLEIGGPFPVPIPLLTDTITIKIPKDINVSDWFSDGDKFKDAVKVGVKAEYEAQFIAEGLKDDDLENKLNSDAVCGGINAIVSGVVAKKSEIEKGVLLRIPNILEESQKKIEESHIAYSEAAIMLRSKQDEFKYTLKGASDKIGVKIDFNSIVEFDVDEASELMISMAGVNLDVTRYAKGIYRNQIAMLVQKNYYDVLYAEKVMDLKRVARERGETQYNILQLSYDNGMKSKDDLLLSKMYYDATVIEYHMAEANYEKALLELYKNMNLDLDTEITLHDNMMTDVTEDDLEAALKIGQKNRIEIQQCLGQLMIYKLNEELLATKYKYRDSYDVNNEARLLVEASEIELDQTKTLVETEIRQSYVVMVAAGEMLKASEELVKDAEEVLEIAQLKYDQGFGAENSLLNQMNLSQSSGTIIELVAAQENLVKIQAQVAQIRYSYTMAKIKYFNDAGILVY